MTIANVGLESLHIVIYDGLPVDQAIPFEIKVLTAFEAILPADMQYLNPPARPDYSKETFDKLIEIVSTNAKVWALNSEF